MNKTTAEIEIPKNATDPIFRLLVEDVVKTLRTARAIRKDRITVMIKQGD